MRTLDEQTAKDLHTLLQEWHDHTWTLRDEANAVVYHTAYAALRDLYPRLDDLENTWKWNRRVYYALDQIVTRTMELIALQRTDPEAFQTKLRTHTRYYAKHAEGHLATVRAGGVLERIRTMHTGLTLDQAADAMKYSPEYLDRLEAGNFHHLSHEFLTRAFKVYFDKHPREIRELLEENRPIPISPHVPKPVFGVRPASAALAS